MSRMREASVQSCLEGLLSEESVLEMAESRWREIQYLFMIDVQTRLAKLEQRAGWRNTIMAIPWAILGGVLTFIITKA